MRSPCTTSASPVKQVLPGPRLPFRSRRLLALCVAGLVLLCGSLSRAVVVTDGTLPFASRLILTEGLAPDELLAYQLQGRFRGFLGTPIGEDFFLTAQHIGISSSDTISFSQGPNAGTYPIRRWYDDPDSDLRIVEIEGSFTEWAPLYAANDEPGRTALLFGRGGAPGDFVVVGSELKGWKAMAPDGATSWGRNVVESGVGNEIYARFEINGLAVEGGLSSGDSGGAWFIRDGLGLLRIAAISFAMTGPYQADAGGAPDGLPFEAPLFDIGGLWVGNPGSEVFIDENPVPIPAALFGTRVSKRLDWIGLIVGFSPEDTDGDGVPNDQDNCPYRANADQLDAAGLGFSSPPDGIGDVCQCGDVTGEGQVNDTDATFIRRQALGLSAPLFLVPGNCDVTGEGLCNGTDATLIRHAAAGNVSALFGQNCPNALP
jgi:hypothetical protein